MFSWIKKLKSSQLHFNGALVGTVTETTMARQPAATWAVRCERANYAAHFKSRVIAEERLAIVANEIENLTLASQGPVVQEPTSQAAALQQIIDLAAGFTDEQLGSVDNLPDGAPMYGLLLMQARKIAQTAIYSQQVA